MPKRKKSLAVITCILAVGIALTGMAIQTAADGGASAGSVDDPLITKSYLDQQLSSLVAAEIARLGGGAAVATATPAPSTSPSSQPTTAKSGQPVAAAELEVVQLQAGQTLYADAGTEVIVRTGKTIIVSTEDGVPDITSGKDLPAGTAVELNHLLIFPRDGRGIKPDSKNKASIYVMVRGGYSIKNAD